MSDKKLKNYYEKFCFLNHMIESDLSTEESNKYLLRKFGFNYKPSREESDVFTNIVIKNKQSKPSVEQLDTKDSMDLYVICNY